MTDDGGTARLGRCTFAGCAWRWTSGQDHPCADHADVNGYSPLSERRSPWARDVSARDGCDVETVVLDSGKDGRL